MLFLTNYGLKEFLRSDEEDIYNRIMEWMNNKWDQADTDYYIQLTTKYWQEQYEACLEDFTNF